MSHSQLNPVETITVEGLTFAVQYSIKRKSIGITVERDSSLSVILPELCALDDAIKVIESKLLWVHTKLAQKSLYMAAARQRQFVTGEGFYYLGRSYRLLIETIGEHPAPLRLHYGRFLMSPDALPDARQHFIIWYIQRAQTWLWERANRFTARVGVKLRGIEITEMAYQWGECLPDGDLRLHWRVILLPPPIIDYVLVHELVHLREPNHGPHFWERVERIIPDWPGHKVWLAENGAGYGI